MANICTNKFYADVDEFKKENYKDILEELLTEISKITDVVYHTDEDDIFLEIDFESRWDFPQEEVQSIVQKLIEKYDIGDGEIYIRCLSYEFGCDYVEYITFKNGKWRVNSLSRG